MSGSSEKFHAQGRLFANEWDKTRAKAVHDRKCGAAATATEMDEIYCDIDILLCALVIWGEKGRIH